MTRTLGIVFLILLFACQTSAADTPQSRDALSNDASSVRSSDADTRSSPTQGAQHTYDTRNTRATQTAAKLAPVSTAWSTFKSQGVSGIIARSELVTFVRFLLTTLHVDEEHITAGTAAFYQKLLHRLPPSASNYSLPDLLHATGAILRQVVKPEPKDTAELLEDGVGSKRLRALRKHLRKSRLTMPLFDSLGWAQGFERMLLLQWEVYANGLSPMPIVVARSSWIYGTQSVV
uniref:Uncharacterized protein n=1 Tax=Chrysotila carterae TaxID=13221 RepID=A0A7S4C2V3_CHRCT|mmetsp:Transcript_21775/g.46000  ORF Transcript_21775/g.46000 Transcript_21775/m.46000 type:complete len:233 (-) Transcript_21775:88-786(-)